MDMNVKHAGHRIALSILVAVLGTAAGRTYVVLRTIKNKEEKKRLNIWWERKYWVTNNLYWLVNIYVSCMEGDSRSFSVTGCLQACVDFMRSFRVVVNLHAVILWKYVYGRHSWYCLYSTIIILYITRGMRVFVPCRRFCLLYVWM